MPNIVKADCGFDPHDMDAYKEASAEAIKVEDGFDLTGYKNMIVDLSAEAADVTIADFNNMKPGMVYNIVVENGASTQNELVFPSSSTIYSGTITKANAMTVLYTFFTDGHSILCKREVYA